MSEVPMQPWLSVCRCASGLGCVHGQSSQAALAPLTETQPCPLHAARACRP